jgi:hypothetical protein
MAFSSLLLLLAWKDFYSERADTLMILLVLGMFVVRSWLWGLFGQETIHMTYGLLSVRYSMFGIGWLSDIG